MSEEHETIRILVKNEKGNRDDRPCFTAKAAQGAPRVHYDDLEVVGYAEVKKGFPFDRKYSEKEFIEYMKDHKAVTYIKWFEDRLKTEVDQ